MCDPAVLSEIDLAGRQSIWLCGKQPHSLGWTSSQGGDRRAQRRNPWARPRGLQEPAQVQSKDERKEGQDTGAMKEEAVALKESQFVVSGVVVEGETVRQGRGPGPVLHVEWWGT